MLVSQLALKAIISGVVIAIASEVARRNPGLGGLLASLPLVSTLALIWLWRDTGGDASKVADMAIASSLYVLASLPAFAVIAILLRSGFSLPIALVPAVATGFGGYLAMGHFGTKMGWPV